MALIRWLWIHLFWCISSSWTGKSICLFRQKKTGARCPFPPILWINYGVLKKGKELPFQPSCRVIWGELVVDWSLQCYPKSKIQSSSPEAITVQYMTHQACSWEHTVTHVERSHTHKDDTHKGGTRSLLDLHEDSLRKPQKSSDFHSHPRCKSSTDWDLCFLSQRMRQRDYHSAD